METQCWKQSHTGKIFVSYFYIYHIILHLHVKAGQNNFPFSLGNSHLINKMYIYSLKTSLHIKFDMKCIAVFFFSNQSPNLNQLLITEIRQCNVAHFTLFLIMPSNNLCCSTIFARQRKNRCEKGRRLERRKGRFLLDLHQ